MYYVLKWETTRYYLVGPFADEQAGYRWGLDHADVSDRYNGWDVVHLVDPEKAPEVIAVEQVQPAHPEPLYVNLRPTADITCTADGFKARAWFGHTNAGTPIMALVNSIMVRPLLPGEEAENPPRGAEELKRELAQMPAPDGLLVWLKTDETMN